MNKSTRHGEINMHAPSERIYINIGGVGTLSMQTKYTQVRRGPRAVFYSPVYTDDAQCHYRRGATHYIHGNKNIAEKLPKNPPTTY